MSKNVSKTQTRAQEYPDHLNPFDDNYGAEPEPVGRSSKYNTWGATRDHRVTPAKAPLESKPWSAVKPPKLVRRLSLLKNTVGRLSFRRPRRNSLSAGEPQSPGSGSPVPGDFSFTIISPKVKERIRQQVFRTPLNAVPAGLKADSAEPCTERLTSRGPENPQPTSPQPPPRTKLRKKKPPPPPPPRTHTITTADSTECPKSEGSPDSHSASSSITRELERDALSEAEEEPDYSISLCITETETRVITEKTKDRLI